MLGDFGMKMDLERAEPLVARKNQAFSFGFCILVGYMKTLPIHILISLAFFLAIGAKGQLSQGGMPRSFYKMVSTEDVPSVEMPAIDLEKLKAEDAERRKAGKEFDRRFGFTFDVQLNTTNSGIWKNLENGGRVWLLKIKSKGALSLNLTFSKYQLEAGADLFITGKLNKIGALTDFNNQADGKLGTGLIQGEEVLVELFEPAGKIASSRLEVGKITHGYKSPFSIQGWGDSDFCEKNVNCPEGLPWQWEKRAVARIIDNGDVCTGTLVNNVLQDGKPYFLTANHCYSASSTTWIFSFNWEAPTCVTPLNPIPENQTISGSILRARLSRSDFCLLELNNRPPASFNPYYAGWSAINTPPLQSTIIHHPAGDIKKITFDFDPAISWGYGASASNDSSHWQTLNYELNTTTEGGSSGSALFDQNHRIVGQLHGGPASCTNNSSDYYGKFSMSWSLGNTPDTRLRDWLDPLNSGLLTLDGYDPICRRIMVKLPWEKNLDTVTQALPFLWKVKNPNGDGTFQLSSGGWDGKGFVIRAQNQIPAGRKDTLMVSPISVSRYKNIKLSFAHAYRSTTAAQSDTLRVLVSDNCGASFRTLSQFSHQQLATVAPDANPFNPIDTMQWRRTVLSLDSTFNRSDQLLLAFAFSSGSAGTLWLDKIIVSGDSAGLKPIAKIFSNTRTSCTQTSVQFSDSSFFNPNSRMWLFEGGNPASSTASNPVVSYAAPGTYAVTLIVRNDEGSDTLVAQNYISIFSIGQINTPFYENFNTSGVFPPAGYVLSNPNNNVTWVLNPTVNAPGSNGGSLMFDNYSNPNVTGQVDELTFPKLQTAGKPHLKLRLRYAYKFYQGFGGVAPDTLTIGFQTACGTPVRPIWKRGGAQLATAGSSTSIYTPAPGDWNTLKLNLDSLLIYPELSIALVNKFGYGQRLFIDDVYIDTTDDCPNAPDLIANRDSLCVGNTLVLSMDSIPNATYFWTGPNNFASNSRVASRVLSQTNQGGTYTGRINLNGCQSPISSKSISVFALPGIPSITVAGQTLTGPANQAGYVWVVNGDTLDLTSRTIEAPISGEYILIVQNAAGCRRSSAPVQVMVTNLNPHELKQPIRLFPNPVYNSTLIIDGPGSQKVKGLWTSTGKNISEYSIELISDKRLIIKLPKLPAGLYFVELEVEGLTRLLKLSVIE